MIRKINISIFSIYVKTFQFVTGKTNVFFNLKLKTYFTENMVKNRRFCFPIFFYSKINFFLNDLSPFFGILNFHSKYYVTRRNFSETNLNIRVVKIEK